MLVPLSLTWSDPDIWASSKRQQVKKQFDYEDKYGTAQKWLLDVFGASVSSSKCSVEINCHIVGKYSSNAANALMMEK